MRFSQRMGQRPTQLPVQVDSMTVELRNSLWTVIHLCYFKGAVLFDGWADSELGSIAKIAEIDFFKRPVDDLPSAGYHYIENLKKWFLKAAWHDVYDFVEWLGSHGASRANWLEGNSAFEKALRYRKLVNVYLERENSGYRFVGAQLAPITNDTELSEVSDAAAKGGKYESIGAHISASISLISDRTNPDFRNSIKESISAVEAAAKWATGDKNATLGQAIKLLEKSKPLHPALKDGLLKLYGWTSDSEGIRHALQEESDLELADARFFLVICSAFSNYLTDRTKEEKL